MRILNPCLRSTLQIAMFSFAACLGALRSTAQSSAKPNEVPPSHVDMYGGYAYIHPFHSAIAGVPYHDVGNINTTVSVADYFTRHFGVQVEGSYFSGPSKRGVVDQCSPSCASRDQSFYAAEAGPIFRFPAGRLTPYIHVLAGGARVNGPYAQPLTWGSGLTGGGGLDYTVPFAGSHLAIRLFQADMYYSHVDYGHSPDRTRSGVGDVIAVKGSAGLVLKLGSVGLLPVPLTLACTVQPESAYIGDTITVTCTPGYLNAKRNDYSFTSNGGRVTPGGSSASISTVGLGAGAYAVNVHLTQGPKAYQQASWNGGFTMRAYDPPTVTAFTATPAEISSGDTAALTCSAASPQNRPLSYSYTASAGQITGTGPSTTFSSVGLAPGRVTLICNATDDQGRSSSASTTVVILSRSASSSASSSSSSSTVSSGQSRPLCSISFAHDRKRPVRVDNEAKACLDDIALTLNREYTDRLVIVGHQEAGELSQAAAERARNESLYLIQEKGIDPARLELHASATGARSVENFILPLGSKSPVDPETVLVNASTVPQGGEAYGRPRAHMDARSRHVKHKRAHIQEQD